MRILLYRYLLRFFQAALTSLVVCGCASSADPTSATLWGTLNLDYYSGDGGKDIVLALPLPESEGLSGAESHIPLTVRTVLMNDMQSFSAMTVLEPKNEAEIYEEIKRQEESGFYNEEDIIDLGNWQNARYALTGSVTKVPPRSYMLDMHITEMENNNIVVASTKTGDDLAVALSDVTAELLAGMNILLTEKGRQALYSRRIESRSALAQSLLAGRNTSTSFETMHYAYEASYYDLTSADAMNRVSRATGGLVGNFFADQVGEYRRWVGLMKECEDFYRKHLPYEIVYEPILRQTGNTDYRKNTTDLECTIALIKDSAAFMAIKTFQKTLRDTGKLDTWKDDSLSSGPQIKRDVNVRLELLNENGKAVGSAGLSIRDLNRVVFRNVNAADISDTLVLRIASVDGMDAETVGREGYIKISSLEEFNKNLTPYPLDFVTIIDKPTKITGRKSLWSSAETVSDRWRQDISKNVNPYMISRTTITVSEWVIFAEWVRARGFDLRSDTKKVMENFLEENSLGSAAPESSLISEAWYPALTLLSTVEDKPVTGVSWPGTITFCNAYSEFYAKPPVYRRTKAFDFSGTSAQAITDSSFVYLWEYSEKKDSGGFRLPTVSEYRLARFGGDPALRESNFEQNLYGIRGEKVYEGYYQDSSPFRLACSLEVKK